MANLLIRKGPSPQRRQESSSPQTSLSSPTESLFTLGPKGLGKRSLLPLAREMLSFGNDVG